MGMASRHKQVILQGGRDRLTIWIADGEKARGLRIVAKTEN